MVSAAACVSLRACEHVQNRVGRGARRARGDGHPDALRPEAVAAPVAVFPGPGRPAYMSRKRIRGRCRDGCMFLRIPLLQVGAKAALPVLAWRHVGCGLGSIAAGRSVSRVNSVERASRVATYEPKVGQGGKGRVGKDGRDVFARLDAEPQAQKVAAHAAERRWHAQQACQHR